MTSDRGAGSVSRTDSGTVGEVRRFWRVMSTAVLAALLLVPWPLLAASPVGTPAIQRYAPELEVYRYHAQLLSSRSDAMVALETFLVARSSMKRRSYLPDC